VNMQHRQMSSAPRGEHGSIIHHGSAFGGQVGRCQNSPDSGPESNAIPLLQVSNVTRLCASQRINLCVWNGLEKSIFGQS
jgi:hypothetical protein